MKSRARRGVLAFGVLALGAAALVFGVQQLGRTHHIARPSLPGDAEPRIDTAGAHSALTNVPDEATAVLPRSDATLPDPSTPMPADAAQPAAVEGPAPFLTFRVVDAAGATQAGVGLVWVQRSLLGASQSSTLDDRIDADGRLVVAKAPPWWTTMFAQEGAPHAGFLRAVGVRSELPFDAYEATELDDAPGVVWLERDTRPGTVVEVTLPPSGAE